MRLGDVADEWSTRVFMRLGDVILVQLLNRILPVLVGFQVNLAFEVNLAFKLI